MELRVIGCGLGWNSDRWIEVVRIGDVEEIDDNSSSIGCNNKQQPGRGEEARNRCCTVQAQPDWQPQLDEQPAITPNCTNAVNIYNCRFRRSGKNATDVRKIGKTQFLLKGTRAYDAVVVNATGFTTPYAEYLIVAV
ncbi:hypothetical protein Tco_0565763 [Tanacetum coccineum]